MKFIATYLILLISCIPVEKPDSVDSEAQTLTTEHFLFSWSETETTPAEIEKASQFCEEMYTKLVKVVGETKIPDDKIQVLFEGEGVKSNGTKIPPHVDWQGRVHLYRFQQEGYLGAFPHELVHAIRVNQIPIWEGFFEEGFASAISDLIYPEKIGFPTFGYNKDKIIAYFMQQGTFISLSELKQRHAELNLRCQLQTYLPRESFFSYLRNTYGLNKLLKFSNSDRTNQMSLYVDVWGKSFEALEGEWEEFVRSRHSKGEVTRTGEEYFEKTSAKYIPICD